MREEWKWEKGRLARDWDEWRKGKLWLEIIYERRINTRIKIKIKKMKEKRKEAFLISV